MAVAGIDLEIAAGSVFGLIGPNGAGKTTLLKMLSTLSKPDSGRIERHGLDIRENVREARAKIGYMPEQFGTFRGLHCRGYLEYFGRAYGVSGPPLQRSINDILDLTDLSAVEERPTTGLSTGMKQRLSLAKTLLHDPEVLLLDEPSSGLDPRARIEIRSLLNELSGMGETIVISSHILADLEEICSEVAIIEEGALVWRGSPPRNPTDHSIRVLRSVPMTSQRQRPWSRSSMASPSQPLPPPCSSSSSKAALAIECSQLSSKVALKSAPSRLRKSNSRGSSSRGPEGSFHDGLGEKLPREPVGGPPARDQFKRRQIGMAFPARQRDGDSLRRQRLCLGLGASPITEALPYPKRGGCSTSSPCSVCRQP